MTILISSCGTTHHFIPYKSLEQKEWQVSVGWHFDLNQMYQPRTLFWPEISAYYGIGKNYTFGFGGYIPGFISQVSLTKQFVENNGKYWSYYTHINRVFGFNSNPFIEVGAFYSKENSNFNQTFSFGLAYGIRSAWKIELPFTSNNNSILPVIKYFIGGKDIGLSLIHYHGLTKSAIKDFLQSEMMPVDTLIIFKVKEIENITGNLEINLKDGTSVIFHQPFRYTDAFYETEDEFQHWLGNKYGVYYYGSKTIVLDKENIYQSWKNNNDIIITNIPQRLINHIENLNSFIIDNSFGLGLFGHHK